MADVARIAGVSPALVSIVMRGVPGASESTRTRIKSVADSIGYIPDRRAQKLRQTTSRLLGVTFDLQEPFHGDLVEHIYAAADARGYDVMLSATAPSRDEDAAVRSLIRERCEGTILLGSNLESDYVAALGSSVPTVTVMRRSGTEGVGSVRSDDVAGVGLAVDHLVELGHRRIAHIDGGSAPGAVDRRNGFRDAMTRNGLSDFALFTVGGTTETDGTEATKRLMRSEPPSAIIAFNDRCATGVLDYLVRTSVSVPETVAVVGYDDSRLASIAHVQLTSIAQDATALADAAVDAALAQISGADARDTVLTPRLVRRSTT
ncbi:LacI family DNA-binding transcriptional regulator [Rhodococcus sovatensis]|uniref:LacI family DNA-binding transcriptional regulator n=1 Tax=Rhodococcus sovatensis TaxID=1805840 RepID=A0ABZ2PRK9_9NOCA